MKTKEIKGITLISLAVTIVVLLILAGISINTVIGDNGIIKKAQSSAELTKESEANGIYPVRSGRRFFEYKSFRGKNR